MLEEESVWVPHALAPAVLHMARRDAKSMDLPPSLAFHRETCPTHQQAAQVVGEFVRAGPAARAVHTSLSCSTGQQRAARAAHTSLSCSRACSPSSQGRSPCSRAGYR
eukprot:scaffold1423_cov130-Isochrysis_galbana.AAC.2